MLNILEVQDNLKNFSQDQLVTEMQSPSGQAPQFLVLSELSRREKMKQDLNRRMSQDEPTVAEESIAVAGFPQGGIMDMARSLSPKSSIAQNTGINSLPMKSGGVIKAQDGLPLGIRNYNPGNLRKPSGDPFFGTSGMDSGYLTFSDPNYGLRALARNLMTYQDEYGIDNVNSLVDRYAPPSDNPEKSRENYKLALSNILRINPDEQFNIKERMPQLMEGIIKFENKNQMPYSSDQLSTAIDSANIDDELEVANMLLEKPDVPMPKPKNLSNNQGINQGINQDFDNFAGDVKREPIELIDPFTGSVTSKPNLLNKLGIVSLAEGATPQNNNKEISEMSFGERLRKGLAQPSDVENELKLFEKIYRGRDPDNLGNLGFTDTTGDIGASNNLGMLDPKQLNEALSGKFSQYDGVDTQKAVTEEDKEQFLKNAIDAGAFDSEIKTENDNTKNNNETKNNVDEQVNGLLTRPIDESGTSSLEKQILGLMERRTKSAETDKWLALAQAGLAIMSSDKPTLGGAIGQGGLVGLQAMADANARYEEGVIDLINAQAKLSKDSPDLNKVRQRYMEVMELLGKAQLADGALNYDQKINLTDAQLEQLQIMARDLENKLGLAFDARD